MTLPALTIIKSDQPEKWQQILSDLITDPKELLQILELEPSRYAGSDAALAQFPLRVPRPFAARMEKGNWDDPLLRQVLPTRLEELADPQLVADPLAEQLANPVRGLLHKYHGRVLLMTVPHCAVHCRYCFRRHFDYAANTPSRREWADALDYIAADPSIAEVILSGGDPLAASDRQLEWLVARLEAIPHITTLRVHTRLPVVIPQRVNSRLLALFRATRLQVVIVVHCNHANELGPGVAHALSLLNDNRCQLLNQSVLLRDVNDNTAALEQLSRTLFSQHVLPYYLHLPDKVAGTSHFQVTEAKAQGLLASLRERLPGYLVPRLVREDPGASAKTALG